LYNLHNFLKTRPYVAILRISTALSPAHAVDVQSQLDG
jgi:hypothetical protein